MKGRVLGLALVVVLALTGRSWADILTFDDSIEGITTATVATTTGNNLPGVTIGPAESVGVLFNVAAKDKFFSGAPPAFPVVYYVAMLEPSGAISDLVGFTLIGHGPNGTDQYQITFTSDSEDALARPLTPVV